MMRRALILALLLLASAAGAQTRRTEGVIFLRASPPTAADDLRKGDLWVDTDAPVTVYRLTSTSPVTWDIVDTGAPTDATYITQTSNATLTAEQALSALTTGIVKVTNATGVLSTAVAGDFPTLNQNTTGTAAALTANGANCGVATEFAVGVNAAGVAECEAIADADVPNTITINAAAALTANPADCATSTHFAVGITADGTATCEAIADADIPDNITAGGWTDDGTDVRLTTSTDFVGIGVADALAALEVHGSNADADAIVVRSAAGSTKLGLGIESTYGMIEALTNGGSTTNLLLNPAGGAVGIGTSAPAAKLAINGGLHVGGDSDPGDNNLLVDGTTASTGVITAPNIPVTLTASSTTSDAVIATYTAVPGIAFTPLANTNYIIDCFIIYTSTAATTGISFAWDVPAGVTAIHMIGDTTTTAVGGHEGIIQRADNVGSTTANSIITVENVMRLHARLRNGANATSTTLGYTPETANSVSVLINSTCQYRTY